MNKSKFFLFLIGGLLVPFLASAEFSCGTPPTCAELGYSQTSTECMGKKTIKCPFDRSKLFCEDSNIVGEVRIWAESTAPRGWMLMQGQTLSTVTYKDLYAVLGSRYCFVPLNTALWAKTPASVQNVVPRNCKAGQFALPDMNGAVVVGPGARKTLTLAGGMSACGGQQTFCYAVETEANRNLGSVGGLPTVTLTKDQMPSHQHWHTNIAQNDRSDSSSQGYPYGGHTSLRTTDRDSGHWGAYTNFQGGGTAHENMPPFVAINYIIFTGVY